MIIAIIPNSFTKLGRLALDSFVFASRVWLVFYLTLIIHFNIKINIGLWRRISYDWNDINVYFV